LAAIVGCTEHDAVTAPAAITPRFSQLSTDPVVNSLTDAGDGTCDDAGTGDGCTLREAIMLANPLGATITFDATLTSGGAQVITLDATRGQLVIAKNLTIAGPGAELLTVRRAADAATNFRIVEIQRNGTSNVAVTISGLTIAGGKADYAAGIANMVRGNSLTLSRVAVSGNTAAGGTGGAVYNLGTLIIDRSTISGNSAGIQAGGIMALDGAVTITNSTISDNHAVSEGGGIFQLGGGMSLQNVTISGNSAYSGGGISKHSDQAATLTHVTLAGNTATHQAGIYSLVTMPPITLSNTIVANNTGSFSSCSSSGTSTIADGGGNLVYPASSSCEGITPVTTGDPKLAALALNAPGVTATMALGDGSAAIDAALAGACAALDQRGIARPQGVECDIGAYELEQEPSSDATPPVITARIVGTLGSNGWYRGNVTVSWSVDDAESAVTSAACAPTIVSADTPGQGVTCSATSAGGTELESVTIRRDATAPSLAPAVGPTPVLLRGTATAEPNAADALSGVASSSCSTPTTATVGSTSVSCSATDNAGNSATANATYAVTYQFVGFGGSVIGDGVLNVVKAGQNVLLKWRLLDAAGTPITNLTAASVAVSVANLACGTVTSAGDAVTTAAGGGNGGGGGAPTLRNLGDGNYQYTWSTPKNYANTCKTMQLSLGEGTTHDALFKFTK
jgi:CSLREA domain-containing protein